MQKIVPFLWFDARVEEAIEFYLGIFKDSKVISSKRGPGVSFTSAVIELDGQRLTVFNGGPMYQFNESVSLVVNCNTQEEIDEKWEKLSEGGKKLRCAWLKDRYGLCWQVTTPIINELIGGADSAVSNRVMNALLKMDKIIIADILKAARK